MLRLARCLTIATLATVLPVAGVQAKGGPKPVFTVSPTKVKVGGEVQAHGKHLEAGRFYILLLALPNNRAPVYSRFLGPLAKADDNGNVWLRGQVPKSAVCGRATVYANSPGSKTMIGVPLTIVGCKTAKKGAPPPPPPAP